MSEVPEEAQALWSDALAKLRNSLREAEQQLQAAGLHLRMIEEMQMEFASSKNTISTQVLESMKKDDYGMVGKGRQVIQMHEIQTAMATMDEYASTLSKVCLKKRAVPFDRSRQ